MKLYHGTSAKLLETILQDGLKPRGKAKGNWQHSVLSNPDAIYLTSAYALYFASIAAKKDEDMLVIEIDTDMVPPWNLVPDEDFLEQATKKEGPAPIDKPMAFRTRWYRKRLRDFAHVWDQSVSGIGNAAYLGEISPHSITRAAVIPGKLRVPMIMAGMDPLISIMNYHILGQKYRNWTRWAFGDEQLTAPDAFGVNGIVQLPRDGITVKELKP